MSATSNVSHSPDEENHLMNNTNETTKYVDREYEAIKSARDTVVRYAAEVVCAGLRFAWALLTVASVAWGLHTGVLAPWLDANGGRWAWMAAGAIAAFFVFNELPASVRYLDEALMRLWLVRRAIARGVRR